MHAPRSSRPARVVAGAALLAVVAAGCSSDSLDVEGFAAGACTDIAPTLQDVDEALRQVGDEDIEPRAAGDRFEAAREVLQPVADSGDEPAEPVQALITQLGFFRIGVDSNNYDGTQDDAVRTALDGVVEACTT